MATKSTKPKTITTEEKYLAQANEIQARDGREVNVVDFTYNGKPYYAVMYVPQILQKLKVLDAIRQSNVAVTCDKLLKDMVVGGDKEVLEIDDIRIGAGLAIMKSVQVALPYTGLTAKQQKDMKATADTLAKACGKKVFPVCFTHNGKTAIGFLRELSLQGKLAVWDALTNGKSALIINDYVDVQMEAGSDDVFTTDDAFRLAINAVIYNTIGIAIPEFKKK